MSEHIYVGSGKEKIFDNGGSIISVSLNMDDIRKHWADYGFTTSSGKQILKLKIGKRREEGKYGETHTVEIDTWKPHQDSGEDPF